MAFWKRAKPISDDKAQEITLTASESGPMFQSFLGVHTVTFYEGNPKAAKSFLEERVESILKANPWLGGMLVKKGKRLAMRFDPQKPHAKCFDTAVVASVFGKGKHFDRMWAAERDVLPFLVKPANEMVGKFKTPLFKVSLLTPDENSGKKSLALIVSLSHQIGDGHTFYKLYGMLDPNADVYALNPQRPEDWEAEEKRLTGGWGWSVVWKFMPGFILNTVSGKMRKLRNRIYELCPEAIKARKEQEAKAGGVEFVSTNDLISARWMKAIQADVSVMAINLRNRVTRWTDLMAGNFETLVWYAPTDVSPALIRKSLAAGEKDGFRGQGQPPSEFPRFRQRLKCRYTACVSWVTFYTDVNLPDCTQVYHMPVPFAAPLNRALIYRPSADRIAIWAQTLDDEKMAAVDKELKDIVNAEGENKI